MRQMIHSRQWKPGGAVRKGELPLSHIFLAAIAVLYPFHHVFGTINCSVGDFVVSALVFIPQMINRPISMPIYAVYGLVPLGLAILSMAYALVANGVLVSLDDGFVATIKLAACIFWLIAVFWLLDGDVLGGMRTFAIVSTLVGTVCATATLLASLGMGTERPSGPFGNPNLYANYLMMILGLSMTLTGSTTWARTLAYIAMPTIVLGILATGSRGGLIGTVVLLALAHDWRSVAREPRRLVPILAAAVILIGASVWFLSRNQFVQSRLASTIEGSGPNTESRTELWNASYNAFRSAPILGIGYGQFPNLAAAKGLPRLPTHNTYLSYLAETGLLGLVAYLLLPFIALSDAYRVAGSRARYVLLPIAGILLGTLVQGLVTNIDNFRSLWICTGIVSAVVSPHSHIVYRRSPKARPMTTGRLAISGSRSMDSDRAYH